MPKVRAMFKNVKIILKLAGKTVVKIILKLAGKTVVKNIIMLIIRVMLQKIVMGRNTREAVFSPLHINYTVGNSSATVFL